MTHLWKKNLKRTWKRRSTELQNFPISPRQDGLKWAAILRISHFQKSKCLQTVICLRGTIGKYFKRVRGFWGLQGGSGQTSQNGHFGPFRPFWGVCPELPWSPQNPLTLLNYSLMVLLKHMTVWRHFHFWKCEILRMAAHFSPSCLGLMGKLWNSVDLVFQILFQFFLDRWVTGSLT